MKTIKQIIENYGGMNWLKQGGNYIRIEKPGYERLVIEYIGDQEGKPDFPMISVAHYYEQNGDAMRDPEMTFMTNSNGNWFPMTYQTDNPPSYQEAIWKNENDKWMINQGLIKDLTSFSNQWDRNIREQGFADVPVKTVA